MKNVQMKKIRSHTQSGMVQQSRSENCIRCAFGRAQTKRHIQTRAHTQTLGTFQTDTHTNVHSLSEKIQNREKESYKKMYEVGKKKKK